MQSEQRKGSQSTQEFTITVSIPEEIIEKAEQRKESFIESHPGAEFDLMDFVIDHFEWDWSTEVPEYEPNDATEEEIVYVVPARKGRRRAHFDPNGDE